MSCVRGLAHRVSQVDGRSFRKERTEFGGCIIYMQPGTKGRDKFESRWQEGIWFGVVDRSLELIMGTNAKVIKLRDVVM